MGSGPPASAITRSSVCRAMKASIVAASPVDGQEFPPAISVLSHLSAYRSSHFVKSGATPSLAAFDSSFSRQKPYFPAVLSLLDSHLAAASSAHAVVDATS